MNEVLIKREQECKLIKIDDMCYPNHEKVRDSKGVVMEETQSFLKILDNKDQFIALS
ncbi:MAG: hypothetical protein WA667_21550 [Candidatus Nitrosopolaris sp.]